MTRDGRALLIVALAGATCLAFIDRQLLNLLVDPIRADMGISDTQLSLLQGLAFVLFYSLGAIPLAAACGRYTRRSVLLFSIAAWSLMTLLFGLATSLPIMFLARAGVALGEAGLSPAAVSLIRDTYTEEKQPAAVALISLGIYVGGGLSLVIGGPALGALGAAEAAGGLPFNLAPWRLLFLGCALLGLPALLAGLAIREPARIVELSAAPPSWRGLGELVRRSWAGVLAFIVAYVAFNALLNAVMAWGPSLFLRDYGWTPRQAGVVYGLAYILCGVTGALGGGYIARRLIRRGVRGAMPVMLIGAAAIATAGSAVLALSSTGGAALAGAGLILTGISAIVAQGAFAFQTMFPARYSARAVALFVVTTVTTGGSLGPTLVPLVSRALGTGEQVAPALALTSCCCCLLGILGLCVVLLRRADQPDFERPR